MKTSIVVSSLRPTTAYQSGHRQERKEDCGRLRDSGSVEAGTPNQGTCQILITEHSGEFRRDQKARASGGLCPRERKTRRAGSRNRSGDIEDDSIKPTDKATSRACDKEAARFPHNPTRVEANREIPKNHAPLAQTETDCSGMLDCPGKGTKVRAIKGEVGWDLGGITWIDGEANREASGRRDGIISSLQNKSGSIFESCEVQVNRGDSRGEFDDRSGGKSRSRDGPNNGG